MQTDAMKNITTFKDASAVQLSLDAVITNRQDGAANFVAGIPITVRTGQRLIVTTAGIWMEDFEEAYQDGGQSA